MYFINCFGAVGAPVSRKGNNINTYLLPSARRVLPISTRRAGCRDDKTENKQTLTTNRTVARWSLSRALTKQRVSTHSAKLHISVCRDGATKHVFTRRGSECCSILFLGRCAGSSSRSSRAPHCNSGFVVLLRRLWRRF